MREKTRKIGGVPSSNSEFGHKKNKRKVNRNIGKKKKRRYRGRWEGGKKEIHIQLLNGSVKERRSSWVPVKHESRWWIM